MTIPKKNKEPFEKILNAGAEVDDIFREDSTAIAVDDFQPIEVVVSARDLNGAQKLGAPQEVAQESTVSMEKSHELQIDNSDYFIQKKFQALETLILLLNREMKFGELISSILKVAFEQIRSEAGSVFEIDHVNNDYFFRAVAGKSSEALLKIRIPKGSGIVGKVCESKQGAVMSMMKDSQMHLKAISNVIGFGVRDVLACPIVIRGRVFGCIELLNPMGTDHYSSEDQEILQSVCDYAAVIIENRLVLAAFSRELADQKNMNKKAA